MGEDSNLSVKIVVAKDGENFSSADVIGTISNDELPTSDAEPVEFSFPFSGYTGNIRLGYYFEGMGSDMSWYELFEVATLEDAVSVQSIKADNGDGKVYNLQGVQLNNPQRGVNIVNGKKVVVRYIGLHKYYINKKSPQSHSRFWGLFWFYQFCYYLLSRPSPDMRMSTNGLSL